MFKEATSLLSFQWWYQLIGARCLKRSVDESQLLFVLPCIYAYMTAGETQWDVPPFMHIKQRLAFKWSDWDGTSVSVSETARIKCRSEQEKHSLAAGLHSECWKAVRYDRIVFLCRGSSYVASTTIIRHSSSCDGCVITWLNIERDYCALSVRS